MKPILHWSPQAREDLIGIYVTIGLDQESVAERIYSEIEEEILRLRDFPRIGVRRREIAPSARMLVHGTYLILYETYPDNDEGTIEEIEIVRIVHGHRELSRVF